MSRNGRLQREHITSTHSSKCARAPFIKMRQLSSSQSSCFRFSLHECSMSHVAVQHIQSGHATEHKLHRGWAHAAQVGRKIISILWNLYRESTVRLKSPQLKSWWPVRTMHLKHDGKWVNSFYFGTSERNPNFQLERHVTKQSFMFHWATETSHPTYSSMYGLFSSCVPEKQLIQGGSVRFKLEQIWRNHI